MKLNLYMKSGNVIVLNGINNYKVTKALSGHQISSISFDRSDKVRGEKLVIQSLDLSQIEAITWEDE